MLVGLLHPRLDITELITRDSWLSTYYPYIEYRISNYMDIRGGSIDCGHICGKICIGSHDIIERCIISQWLVGNYLLLYVNRSLI